MVALGQGEALLAPGFIDGDGHSVRQVEAAAAGLHGQAQALFGGQAVENVRGQATAFRAKQEDIAGPELDVGVGVAAFSGKGEYPTSSDFCYTVAKCLMSLQCCVFVVVQTSPPQAFVV